MTSIDIIRKIGVYKVIYFIFGLVVSALCSILTMMSQVSLTAESLTTMVGITIFVMIISTFKEICNGRNFNWENIVSCVLGTIPVWIVTAFAVYLNILNQ